MACNFTHTTNRTATLYRYATHLFKDVEEAAEDNSPRNFWVKDMATAEKELKQHPSRLTALKDDHHEEEYW